MKIYLNVNMQLSTPKKTAREVTHRNFKPSFYKLHKKTSNHAIFI